MDVPASSHSARTDREASPSPDDLLTIAEAAELLSVSAVTVSRWRRQGRLPTLKVGPRAVRIRRGDLALLARPYRGPASSLTVPAGAIQPPEPDGATGPTADEAGPPRQSLAFPAMDNFPPPASTLERAGRLRSQILARRRGDYLPVSDDMVGKIRAKRDRGAA